MALDTIIRGSTSGPEVVITKKVRKEKPVPSVRLPAVVSDDRLASLALALDMALDAYIQWAEEDDTEALLLML